MNVQAEMHVDSHTQREKGEKHKDMYGLVLVTNKQQQSKTSKAFLIILNEHCNTKGVFLSASHLGSTLS